MGGRQTAQATSCCPYSDVIGTDPVETQWVSRVGTTYFLDVCLIFYTTPTSAHQPLLLAVFTSTGHADLSHNTLGHFYSSFSSHQNLRQTKRCGFAVLGRHDLHNLRRCRDKDAGIGCSPGRPRASVVVQGHPEELPMGEPNGCVPALALPSPNLSDSEPVHR